MKIRPRRVVTPVARLFTDLSDRIARWPGSLALQRILEECPTVDLYLAGGAVRDSIARKPGDPRDYDFFLGGRDVDRALQILARYGHFSKGPFGSPRWFPQPDSSLYADVIPIERFRNGLWQCENIVDALNQFDFTANAVACDLRSGRTFDPQNGVRDITKRVIRAVRFDYPDECIAPGSSLTRLTVLWCRLLHYASVLGFSIEPVTLRWLQQNRPPSKDVESFEAAFQPMHPTALTRL